MIACAGRHDASPRRNSINEGSAGRFLTARRPRWTPRASLAGALMHPADPSRFSCARAPASLTRRRRRDRSAGVQARAPWLQGLRAGLFLPAGCSAPASLVQGRRPEGSDSSDVVLRPLAGRHRGQNDMVASRRGARSAGRPRRRSRAEALTASVPGAAGRNRARLRDLLGSVAAIGAAIAMSEAPRPRRVDGQLAAERVRMRRRRRRQPRAGNAARVLVRQGATRRPSSRRCWTPGMFSHEAVDAGSRLLAAGLPGDIKGTVADFCAGWGYLAAEVAVRIAGAGDRSLRGGLRVASRRRRRTWRLLPERRGAAGGHLARSRRRAGRAERYDAIVMNPPFHRGARRRAGHRPGELIAVAAKAMKPRGGLFMVANRQLPYEAALGERISPSLSRVDMAGRRARLQAVRREALSV